MSTKNWVPRANGEGGIGTEQLKWGNVYAVNGNIANRDIASDGAMIDLHDSAIDTLQTKVTTLEHAYAGAKAAATVADMTDHNQIYVYVGSETGYTNGNWYYWNGTAWTSGGVYNATALETDKTLMVSGAAADAKVTGDNLKLDSTSQLDISNEYATKANGLYQSSSTTFIPASNFLTLTYNVGNISKIRINIDSGGNANSYAYYRALDSNGNILEELLNPGNAVVIDNTITLPSNASTFTVTGRPDIRTTGTNVYKIGLILAERNQAQIDNAMIGYDGKKYSTLGDSVRGQTGQNFGYLEFDRINLNDTKYFTNTGTSMMYSSKETGYYRVGEDTIVSAATSFTTYHYKALPFEKITFSIKENGNAGIYDIYRVYNADGELIEHIENTGTSGVVSLTKEYGREETEIWITSQADVIPNVSHYFTNADEAIGKIYGADFAEGEEIVSEKITPQTGYYRVGGDTLVSSATTYKTFEIDVTTCEEYIIIGTSIGSSANIYDVYRGYDSDGNVIEHIPNVAGGPVSFTYNIKIPNYVTKIAVTFEGSTFKIIKKGLKAASRTNGKTIVWFGTSIPAGQYNGEGTSYPELVGKQLGATVINESVSSSRVHTRNASNVADNNPYGFFDTNFTNVAKCITNDAAIQQWLIDNYNSDFWTDGKFSKMDEAAQNLIKSWGYEEKIDKYLKPNNMPDAFVFDFGRNDMWRARDWTFDDSDPYSTMTSFQAAMNWIIKHILDYNAKAKIILIGHYTNQERNPLDPSNIRDYPVHIAEGQQEVADYWIIPLFKLWEHTGWSNKTISVNGTNKSVLCAWLTDGLHPHSDATGKAVNHIANLITPFIRDNI